MIVLILQKVILEMGSIRGYVVNPLTSTKSHFSFIYQSIHLIQFIRNIYLLWFRSFVVSFQIYVGDLIRFQLVIRSLPLVEMTSGKQYFQ